MHRDRFFAEIYYLSAFMNFLSNLSRFSVSSYIREQ
jgi:hypothetical protein